MKSHREKTKRMSTTYDTIMIGKAEYSLIKINKIKLKKKNIYIYTHTHTQTDKKKIIFTFVGNTPTSTGYDKMFYVSACLFVCNILKLAIYQKTMCSMFIFLSVISKSIKRQKKYIFYEPCKVSTGLKRWPRVKR